MPQWAPKTISSVASISSHQTKQGKEEDSFKLTLEPSFMVVLDSVFTSTSLDLVLFFFSVLISLLF